MVAIDYRTIGSSLERTRFPGLQGLNQNIGGERAEAFELQTDEFAMQRFEFR
jgi:hypothetical protein